MLLIFFTKKKYILENYILRFFLLAIRIYLYYIKKDALGEWLIWTKKQKSNQMVGL